MKNLKFWIMAAVAVIGTSCTQQTQETKTPISKPNISIEGGRMTPEGLWAMGRIGSVTYDIETGLLAYTVSYYSVEENRSTTWIRICEQEGDQLTVVDEFVGSDPSWFGNSGVLAYLKRGKLYLRQEGEDILVETASPSGCSDNISESIDGYLFSPKRDKVILIRQVKTIASTIDKHPDLPLATGHVHEDLMYKHWDEWTTSAPQPFVCDVQIRYVGADELDIKHIQLTEGVNILEGTPYECPMKPFGGVEQLAWNPNNAEIAYTCRKKTGLDYAISTNSDIYLYDLSTGAHKNITKGNAGYDTNPSYSPDGTKIAWQSMERDGYESDWNRLMVMDLETGEQTFVSKQFDSNVDEYEWVDNEQLVFTGCWHALVHLYQIDLDGNISQLTEGQYDFSLGCVAPDNIYLLRHSMCEANEIFCLDKSKNMTQLTFENKNIYDQIERPTVVPRWQKTTDGKQMLTWIIYPPHFDPTKKYPTILYCEGGPQSPVSQFWSYRWNFTMMSAGDYIIVAPNRRGLPGFGLAWNEQISGDYGGQCMRDYFSAIDEFCNEPYVDKDRLGCVGASFGGYSVYWIAGHHEGRFKAFISHDGIFNMEMQYLETEEKWFANWDMGGAYWEKDNVIAQRTFANSPHKFVDKWDTPILCIHGEKDYRILANQAMAAFDAAKMRGVPAQLLIFPDENHWVLQPQNGILWQRTFRDWLDRWLK